MIFKVVFTLTSCDVGDCDGDGGDDDDDNDDDDDDDADDSDGDGGSSFCNSYRTANRRFFRGRM